MKKCKVCEFISDDLTLFDGNFCKPCFSDNEKEYNRAYHQKNKAAILKRKADRYETDREEVYSKQKAAERLRIADSPSLQECRRIGIALKRYFNGQIKTTKYSKYLGCDALTWRNHIESLFMPGMTWDNHSFEGWHVDHILPLASFDHTREEDRLLCWNYKNTQPLWAKQNLSKHARIYPDAVLYPKKESTYRIIKNKISKIIFKN